MSKFNKIRKENSIKDYQYDSKLKEVKESTIKYNNGKDIELISQNYIRENTFRRSDYSKKASDQIPKNNTSEKYSDNENETEREKSSEKEQEKEPEREQEQEKEKENISYEMDNTQYKEKIKELEETIKQMNLDFTNDLQKHKDEIEKKEKDIKKLITTNNNLKTSLEVLTQRLDKVLINSNQQKLKYNKVLTNNNNNNQESLQHQLDIKEKELKNQQSLINILRNDNKNIRNILNRFVVDGNNLNLAEKVQQQYKEIQNLQKDLKEYKLKLSSSQKNLNAKGIEFKTDENSSKKMNFFFNRNKKLMLNSLTSGGYSKFGKFTNKSQSIDFPKKSHKKKTEYIGLNSSYINNVEPVFTNEEINTIKNSFIDEHKYENFINKLNILEKASLTKEKEMNMKIKMYQNKLKEKDNQLDDLKKKSKEKDNLIISLNVENKELKKHKNDLINKLNFLSKTLNELDQKNQLILKKNEQIKNSIFSIDGIIEANTKEGNPIPLLVEVNNGNIMLEKSKNNNMQKNGSDSINQSSGEEKNSIKLTNSDEVGGDN